MKPFLCVLSALTLALPLVALSGGCAGGGTGEPEFVTPQFGSTVQLSSTQTGTFSLSGVTGHATGLFIVSSSGAPDATSSFANVPNGTYPVSGTFSVPASFRVSGTFPNAGPFFIVGQIPGNGGDGNYTLSVGGRQVQGSFQSSNLTPTPRPTRTPRPTATTTTTPAN